MKLTTRKYVLTGAFDKAFGVAPRTSTIPILQNVLLTAAEDGVTVVGTDNELTVVCPLKIEVEETGICLLPQRAFAILKECPDSDVRIEVMAQDATITCEGVEWRIKLEAVEDFPKLDLSHEKIATLQKLELLAALNRCRPPISSDSVRPMFGYVQLQGGQLRASDGGRLHQVALDTALDMLIPARAVPELVKRLRTAALDEIEVGISERCYSFRLDDDLLIVTQHLTEYPALQTLMVEPSAGNTQEVVVNRAALQAAVRRVSLTTDEDTHHMAIELNGYTATLSAVDKFGNRAREAIEVTWEGEPRTLGVSVDSIQDMLGALMGSEVRFYLKDDAPNRPSPLVFREASFLGIMLQVRPEMLPPRRERAADEEPAGASKRR